MEAEDFIEFLFLAVAISAVAFTIARTKVSEGLRMWVSERHTWAGQLIGCPYCLSHWLAFGAAIIYQPRVVELWLPLDLLVAAMAMVAVAAFMTGVIQKALLPPGGKR